MPGRLVILRWDLGLAFDELLDTSLNDACRLVDSASWQASSDCHPDSICVYRCALIFESK